MAEQLKATWEETAFQGADSVEIQLYRGGEALEGPFGAPTTPNYVEFSAADSPGISYGANVRGVYAWMPCTVKESSGGGGGGSSGGGGGA
jgi:hypothetical protein